MPQIPPLGCAPGDSTHACRSPTPTVNGRDLTLSTRTQTSEQEYSDLAVSNRRFSTACSRNTPQGFSQGTLSYAFFLEVDKACEDVFSILPRFLKIFLEWNVVCIASAGTKTALGIIQVWFNYFQPSFFKALGNVNVDHLKIPRKHPGPHKTPSRAACGPRVWDPWLTQTRICSVTL